MRFLADENIHADTVEWLRSSGHDVIHIHAAESLAGNADEVLPEIARVSAPRA